MDRPIVAGGHIMNALGLHRNRGIRVTRDRPVTIESLPEGDSVISSYGGTVSLYANVGGVLYKLDMERL